MPTDAKTISQMRKFDLGVIHRELKSAPEELESVVGQPLELLTVNESEAVYVTPGGFMVVEYVIDDNDITFSNFRFAESIDNESAKKEVIAEFVDAIIGEDHLRADQLWDQIKEDLIPAVIASSRVNAEVEPLRKKIEERLEGHGNVHLESVSDNPIFLRSNYRSLDNLDDVRENVATAIEQSITGEDLNEVGMFSKFAAKWTSKGTGKLRRHKISREKSRGAKRVAKKHRGALLANLRKARKSLVKIAKRSSFRKRVGKAKRLNASLEHAAFNDMVLEIVENQSNPSFAYLTKPDMAKIITQALAFEGTKDLSKKDEEFIETLAHDIIETSREIRPLAKRHLVDAATLVISNHEDLETDDMQEAVEIIAQRLYEAIDENDERSKKTSEKVLATIENLIEELSEEIDEHDTTTEAKEVRGVLETLGEFKSTLKSYIEHPENADITRVYAMLENIDTMFASDETFENDLDEGTSHDGDDDGDDFDENTDFDVPGTIYSEDSEDDDDIEEGCKGKGKKKSMKDDEDDDDDDEEDPAEDEEVEEGCKGKKKMKDDEEEDPDEDEEVEEGCKGKKKMKDDEEEDPDEENMDEGKKKPNLPPWLKAKVEEDDSKTDDKEAKKESKEEDDSEEEEDDDEPEDDGGKKKKKGKKKKDDDDEDEGDEEVPDDADSDDIEEVTFTSDYAIEEENIVVPKGTQGFLNGDGSITVKNEGEEDITLIDVPEDHFEIIDPLA